nr:PREDICTED: uncharacterized protein LOC107397419 isoform X2 [Tribolium castaneum]|eukprot:XP_015839907.1 PREDICTED: uncharacterized protein LOC107397419 isoform X2 [Tribolium castaneum]
MGKSHRSSSRSSSVSSTDAHRRSHRDKSDLERRLRHLERKVRKSRHARKHHTRRSRSTSLSPRHTHERGERTSPLHSSKESEGFDRGTFSRCPTPISLPTNGGEPDTADVLVCLEPDLEKEVLALLGDDPSEKSEEIHLHEALTVRWNYNLTRGLDAQVFKLEELVSVNEGPETKRARSSTVSELQQLPKWQSLTPQQTLELRTTPSEAYPGCRTFVREVFSQKKNTRTINPHNVAVFVDRDFKAV